ncbi:DUF3311 domain-containing protein [uncultured Castellaniella sp.]|uniref:DUF3311 domain-containing protein n=1 Tax=uncultured Castellaniella sp. TaxID=647907 RepID=UPI00260BFC6F|nr:DUF3311 domain-containing protein [uncultured Castellaniella sp.]
MIGSKWAILIATVIPAIAILVGIPVISGYEYTVLGIPLVFFWLFCWLPLTTLCMWLSWHYFERAHYRKIEGDEK